MDDLRFPAFSPDALAPLIERHRIAPGSRATQQSALLPLLHDVQGTFGHVPAACVAPIAAALNLSRAEVHGVITFYHDFRDAPPARHTVRICRAESCQAMGAERLIAHAEAALGCKLHGKSADGRFGIEPAYCLGQCALSPALMIGDSLHARVTPEKFDALIESCGSGDGQ